MSLPVLVSALANGNHHYLESSGPRSVAGLALGALGMQTIHFTAGERLAGQLAALGVAA